MNLYDGEFMLNKLFVLGFFDRFFAKKLGNVSTGKNLWRFKVKNYFNSS